jgi:hypothetical protein
MTCYMILSCWLQACADKLDRELATYGCPPLFPTDDEDEQTAAAAAAAAQAAGVSALAANTPNAQTYMPGVVDYNLRGHTMVRRTIGGVAACMRAVYGSAGSRQACRNCRGLLAL